MIAAKKNSLKPYETTGSYKPEEGLTVKQAAEITGLSEHTLRYYEKIKMIEPVRREFGSKHRRYGEDDISRLRTLACLRAAGMPLEQMRRYFELAPKGALAADELKALLEKQKKALLEQIENLRGNLDYVEHKIEFWDEIKKGNARKARENLRTYQKSLDLKTKDLQRNL